MSDHYRELYHQGMLERKELLATIKQLEQNKAEWISVDDQLPDNSLASVIYYQDGEVGVCDFPHGWHGMIEHGITHWMPLPEPPSTKERDDE